MFNVIVSVPEEWTDYDRLRETCDHLLSNKVKSGEKINIVLTHQKSLAAKYAEEKGFGTLFVPIDWKLGKSACFARDNQLVGFSNACIVFFSSYGTNYQQNSLVDICHKKRVSVRRIEEDN